MAEISFTVKFILEECCSCHTQFAMTEQLNREKRKDHSSFYCPRGHLMCYMEMSETERLRRDKVASESKLQADLNNARHAQLVAEKERDSEKKKRRKIENRIAKGVCPCCNRQFSDLHAHMKTKHKEYALPPGQQKQIAGTVQ